MNKQTMLPDLTVSPVNSNACLLFDLCMLTAILFGEV